MNPKLILALLNNKNQNKGFTVFLATGIGLIMLLVGTTMLLKGQATRTNAAAQKITTQTGAITEAGITRTLSLLNKDYNGLFMTKNYVPNDPLKNQWTGSYTIESSIKDGGCTTSGNSTTVTFPPELIAETPITQNTDQYKYKLLAYNYTSGTTQTVAETATTGAMTIEKGTGTMLLQGTKIINSSDNTQNAKAKLEVSMNVNKITEIVKNSFPGMYIEKTINLGGNDIIASSSDPVAIICQDCQMKSSSYCPPDPESILEGAMGATDGKILTGSTTLSSQTGTVMYNVTPMLGNPKIPPLPPIPSNAINIGEIKKSGSNLTINGVTDNTLPRSGDAITGKTTSGLDVYSYKVSAIDLGNLNLTINTSSAAVHLYVTGNVNLSGTGTIVHNGTFGKFAIFGNPSNTTKPPSTGTVTTVDGVTTSQNFVLSGGSTSQMFVYAPDAKISINGGAGLGDITGVIWAKVWDGSSSTTAELMIPAGAATNLETNIFGSTWDKPGLEKIYYTNSAPTSWQRKEVN